MKGSLLLHPGAFVMHNGIKYKITHTCQKDELDMVIAKDVKTGIPVRLNIYELLPPDEPKSDSADKKYDLATIPDTDWMIAQQRYAIIRPLIDMDRRRTAKDVEECAKQANVHKATLYRWIDVFEKTRLLSSLIPTPNPGPKGQTRLTKEVEEVINSEIEASYLIKPRPSTQEICTNVIDICKTKKLKPPHENTVRRRITVLSEEKKLKARPPSKQTKEKGDEFKDAYPDATSPLSVVQIDHTPGDIIIVDDIDRLPIGRPYITLAIDVFSRMVAGIYISLDAPSSLSIAMCLSQAILRKDNILAKYNIKTTWNVWGFMGKIHSDNAKEFRSAALERACMQYGIDIEWSPVARPQFGAYIESLFGTFADEIHKVPGTTFSSVKEKGDYDSEASAVMTLSEFEEWFYVLITQKYHHSKHSELKCSPLKKFADGLKGSPEAPGTGLPPMLNEDEGARLKIDFMPHFERTVQDKGILLDYIYYYHDVLRRWINSKDPKNPKDSRLFIIKRDPRDISSVFFLDPEVNEYLQIPYRNLSRPAINIWEHKAALKLLHEEGAKDIDEDMIFNARQRQKDIIERATRLTKKARRMRQRKSEHEKDKIVIKPSKAPEIIKPQTDVSQEPIEPFDELEML